MTIDGEIIAQETAINESVNTPNELLVSIASFKKTALQFGETLNQTGCPVMHIKGNAHLFSLYDVDTNLLAFYSEMHGALLESFNTSQADSRMAEVVQELEVLIKLLPNTKK